MRKLTFLFLSVVFLAFDVSGCAPGSSTTTTPETPVAPSPLPEKGDQAMSFELTSTAFAHGEKIPARFTCDGDDVSPALQWTDPPQGTQSFALICDDPDAPMGTWVHWVLYNLPGDARALAEAFPSDADLPDGSRHGQNSWKRPGYGGPCPPSGTHRYFFKLYALDTVLDLMAGASKQQLLDAMEGHVLAQAELMGVYARR